MRVLVVLAAVLVAGCGEPLAEPERDVCPRPGYVRSGPLEPVPSTAQPPTDALHNLSLAFAVAPPQGEPRVTYGPQAQSWVWEGEDRFAVATVREGITVQLDLRVEGNRFSQDPEAAVEALREAATAYGLPGEPSLAGGTFGFAWDTGVAGGGPWVEESVGQDQNVYGIRPTHVPPDDALPPSTYGSVPARALTCLLADAGAFLGASGATMSDERLALDDADRLERIFVYSIRDAACHGREAHVRFDALTGTFLGAALRPC